MIDSKHPRPHFDFWSRLAVAYPFGLAPRAPGTFGSLPGLALGALIFKVGQSSGLSSDAAAFAIAIPSIGLATFIAWMAIDRTEKLWGTHDDGSIVIDEVVGQAIPLAFLGYDPLILGLSFVLFRLLDITKPGLIGWCDRELHGAWGTLLDDVVAGICTLPLVFALSSLLGLAL